MKIGGIAGGKHPSVKKGEVIELSPDKKVEAQAKQELSDRSDEGFKFLPTKAVVKGTVQVIKGRDLKNPEPSQFIGTVVLTYRPLRLKDDRLFQERTKTVKLHVTDSQDDLGLPDLKTLSYAEVK